MAALSALLVGPRPDRRCRRFSYAVPPMTVPARPLCRSLGGGWMPLVPARSSKFYKESSTPSITWGQSFPCQAVLWTPEIL